MPELVISAAKTARDWDVLWAIRDAQEKAYMEGDGEPQAIHLIAALAKHGLVIVEARRLERLTVAIQLIGSAAAALVGEG
jgi:hypothetical protein